MVDGIEKGKYSLDIEGIGADFENMQKNDMYNYVTSMVPGVVSYDAVKIYRRVDSKNKRFVNRFDAKESIKEDENFKKLRSSIAMVGLIHPIFVWEEKPGVYTVISGYRRFCAVEDILENKEDLPHAIIHVLPENTPVDILESISLAENVHRKDLTAQEFAFKAVKSGNCTKESLTKFCEDHQFTQSYTSRILKCLEMPAPLLEILGDISMDNAITINRIIKLQPERDAEELIHDLMDKSRDDLRIILKELKSEKKGENKERYKIKATSRTTNLTLNRKLDEKQLEKLQKMVDKFLDGIK